MNSSFRSRAASLAPLLLSAFGAAMLPAPVSAADPVPLSLNFAAEIAGQPFACGQRYANLGRTDAEIAFADFRLFVSEVALLAADGRRVPMTLDDDGRWQDGQVALLDFEDATDRCDNGTPPTNAQVSGSLPAGDYTGVEFVIGVPFDSNHGDPTLAASPLNLTSMFWNWRGGYRFLKIDMVAAEAGADADAGHGGAGHGDAMGDGHGAAAGGGHAGGHGNASAGAWMLHLGSTGCESPSRTSAPSQACAQPNRVTVTFNDFDAGQDVIVIDPAALLADSDLGSNAPDTSPGCMSFPGDPDCASVLPKAGLAYGDMAGGEQQLATVRRDAQ